MCSDDSPRKAKSIFLALPYKNAVAAGGVPAARPEETRSGFAESISVHHSSVHPAPRGLLPSGEDTARRRQKRNTAISWPAYRFWKHLGTGRFRNLNLMDRMMCRGEVGLRGVE